jgi:hypothetical protein
MMPLYQVKDSRSTPHLFAYTHIDHLSFSTFSILLVSTTKHILPPLRNKRLIKMRQDGFLVPPNYHDEGPNPSEMNIVSVIFGFGIAAALFTAAKAAHQTHGAYKRGKVWNAYVVMIWSEWLGSCSFGLISYLWLSDAIGPRSVFRPSKPLWQHADS